MKKQLWLLIVIAIIILGLAVTIQQVNARKAGLDDKLQTIIAQQNLAPLALPPAQDPAKVRLGQMLFFEKELSGNRDISCATCHQPGLATGDGIALSIGTGGSGVGPLRLRDPQRPFIPRHANELLNRGSMLDLPMFWDGRVEGTVATGFSTPAGTSLPAGLDNILAAQAMFPVTSRDEMRGGFYDIQGYNIQPGQSPTTNDYQAPAGWHDVDVFGNPNDLAGIGNLGQDMPQIWDGLMARLWAIPAYTALFQAAYPGVPLEEMGFVYAANAIAAFEIEAFVALNSPWQRYLQGEGAALSAQAKQGALLFFGPAGCAACHSGSYLSDGAYHNLGVPQFGPGRDDFAPLDFGRFAVTGNEADRFAFRTPPLHNVTLTGPWLHNGAYYSLADVIGHHLDPAGYLAAYDGHQLPADLRPTLQQAEVTQQLILATLDSRLATLPSLSEREISYLLAFLEALSDPAGANLSQVTPTQLPSGLPIND